VHCEKTKREGTQKSKNLYFHRPVLDMHVSSMATMPQSLPGTASRSTVAYRSTTPLTTLSAFQQSLPAGHQIQMIAWFSLLICFIPHDTDL
jgi:hypothetical protein